MVIVDPKIDTFIHIGIIVSDIEKAKEHYEELGFGPWDGTVLHGGQPGEEKIFENGEPCDKGLICKWDKSRNLGVELEIIEPGEVGRYREWFDVHGPGIHHVCCYSSQSSYADIKKKMVDMTGGRDIYIDGHIESEDDDAHEWAYIDLRPEIGMIIELSGDAQG